MTVTAVIILVMLVALPGIPIIFAWDKVLKERSKGLYQAAAISTYLPLLVTSLSFAWLVVGLVWGSAIGPDYTTRRFSVIYANLGVVIANAIFSVFVRSPVRGLISLASVAVALDWFYAAAISSVV